MTSITIWIYSSPEYGLIIMFYKEFMKHSIFVTLIGLVSFLVTASGPLAYGQSYVPDVFDPIDPIDMKRMTSENMPFNPYKQGVLAIPIKCTTPAEIIESAVNSAIQSSGNNSNTNTNTTQAVKELATGQVGISDNMTGQALDEAMNTIVCIPSITNETSNMGLTQDNLTNVQNGTFIQ